MIGLACRRSQKMRNYRIVGHKVLLWATAGILLGGTMLACQSRSGRGLPRYTFTALNEQLTTYEDLADTVPQLTFTDDDEEVWVYFFGPFATGDTWFIRFLSPSGTGDRDSDELTVAEGATKYFVSAGGKIALFTENDDWEIALFINGEEIGRGAITINRASLGG
jgi:hypothetical protein